MKEQSKTIEEMLEEVEEIITSLESGEIPLEESFAIYEKGMKLVKSVNSRIDKVEKKVIQLDAEENPETGPETEEEL